MSFTPSDNLADQIAKHLSEKIIIAEFKPGERIIEDKLARELGVSRSPLREALRMLEKEGLVELMPRHGVRVTTINREHVACIYDILTELYALLVRRLFECVTDDIVRQIDEAIKKLERCAKEHSVEGYYNALFDFGAVALRCVNMPLLERMITDLWPSKRRVEYYITGLRRNDLVQNAKLFRQGYKYALAGDGESVVQAIRTYTQGEKEYALKYIPLEV
jgi:DNA-binding GntR family transcriptional regulator